MKNANSTNSQVQTFNFQADLISPAHRIRVVTVDGAPWFVTSDVSEALGFTYENAKYHIKNNLSDDESGVMEKRASSQTTLSLFPGTTARVSMVSESALYKLILRSNVPTAKPFQDWVTKVVLPAIRKDGAYIMGEEKVVTGEMSEDELVLKAVGILQKKVERLTAERDLAIRAALVPELPYKVLYKPRGVVV